MLRVWNAEQKIRIKIQNWVAQWKSSRNEIIPVVRNQQRELS